MPPACREGKGIVPASGASTLGFYRDQGYAHAQRCIDNTRARITTKSGQAIADAVLETGSLDWLRAALGEKER